MRKLTFAFAAAFCMSVLGFTGCSEENQVIEAPAADTPDISEENPDMYNKSMAESMGPGAG